MDDKTFYYVVAGLMGAVAVLFRMLVANYERRIKGLEDENERLRGGSTVAINKTHHEHGKGHASNR